ATRYHHPEWVMEYLAHAAKPLSVIAIGFGIMWWGRSRRWDLAGVLLVAAAAIYGMSEWTISAKPGV
ncbi:MAG: hypothetical protein ABIO29_08875, partial [Sphingomicrobium sp.]